jgi:hypothetical protein
MKIRWRSSTLVAVCLLTWTGVAAGSAQEGHGVGVAATADGATVFRVFLNDGTSLVSYGELARVDARVVFSMPTSASIENPQLHLVNISADQVDWDRTTRYAEAARAARYMATMADSHYAALTVEIGQALNDISLTTDPVKRLAIVERARKTLADWPSGHFNYKQAEINQMLASLDEAIAELRAAAGLERFDLSFVASVQPEPREVLLPMPTPKEAIEQTLTAGRLADSPAERVSLMAVALASIDSHAAVLPSDWRTALRRTTRATIALELETDQKYQSFASRMQAAATGRARAADVRGIERLIAHVHDRDRELGGKRPETVSALIASLEAELDRTRRLRLERDRWSLRLGDYQRYRESVSGPMARLNRLKDALEDIKGMAGSAPDALAAVERGASQALVAMTAIVPPEEFRAAHALAVSAAQLADSAARIRREAALIGSIARAWDASAAAAGALMLTGRARTEIQELLRLPQLPQ